MKSIDDGFKTTESDLRVFKIFISEPVGVHPEAEGLDKLKTLWFSQDGHKAGLRNRASIEEILSRSAVGFDEGYGYGCFRDRKQAVAYEKELPTIYTIIKELRIPRGSRYRVEKINAPGKVGDGVLMCFTERLGECG